MEATAGSDPQAGGAVERVFRSCPVCEASCGLSVSIDRAAGRILSVRGDPDDHRSRGYVCAKSQVLKDLYEDPSRLRRPVRVQMPRSQRRPVAPDRQQGHIKVASSQIGHLRK